MTLDDFFNHIQQYYSDDLPFVVYRKPNKSELVALCQKDSTLYQILDFTESGFVFSPFDSNEKSILIPYSEADIFKSEVAVSNDTRTTYSANHIPENCKDEHIGLVRKAIDTIMIGELQKVVVSRAEPITLSDENPIAIFKNLLNKYESAFVYCWYHPKIGLWLGATPETFIQIEGNKLSTMALAGTQKFNGELEVNWQNKEIKEQQIVTDFIVESLKSSVEKLKVFKTETIKAGNLLHLKTEITANFTLGSLNLKQIIQNLHPTPAVCGLPKETAKKFIFANENYNRSYYTGFLGELNLKEKKSRNTNRNNVENDAYSSIKTTSNLFVNLRCMQLKGATAIIYVGGGITEDSNPEKEWEETVSKSEVIKSIL